LNEFGELHYQSRQREFTILKDDLIPVSPASPEKVMRVCVFRARVLSSSAFRMVAPRMAAFEQAIKV
jgi:hypothetical protein